MDRVELFLRSVLVLAAVLAALAGPVVLTTLLPELAERITAAGRVIVAVTGSIIGIAVVLWALVGDADWSLKEAITLVAILLFLAGGLATLVFFLYLRTA